MQSSNGNFEKYKSEMLRMYQQKNRPVGSIENEYVQNNKNDFYENATRTNNMINDVKNEPTYFPTQISDDVRLGDDFPPVSYRQDISPHTMRGDVPIEYDSSGNRTSALIFDDFDKDMFELNGNENSSTKAEFSNSKSPQNFEKLQSENLNLEEITNNNLKSNKDDIKISENIEKEWANFENRNTSNGFLKVQVYSAQGAFPLKDAKVVISKKLDNDKKIFYEMITDESGITQPVPLPAPDASHSFVVDGMRPYENYDIEVLKQGFQSSFREGLPIFPGVVSLQPIQLRPLLASEQDNK